MKFLYANTLRLCICLLLCAIGDKCELMANEGLERMPAPHISAETSPEFRAALERSNPYKRFIWFGEQRMDADGQMYSDKHQAAAQEFVRKKRGKARADGILAEDVWTPVGPMSQPPSLLEAPVSGMGRTNCILFHPSDPQIFWVGAASGGIWETRNGGTTWTPRGDALASLRIADLAIDPRNPDLMYAATGDKDHMLVNLVAAGGSANYASGLWRSMDGGITWERSSLRASDTGIMSRILIHPDDSNLLTAAGVNGVFVSTDKGATWTRTSQEAVFDLERDPRDGNILHAATAFGVRRIMYSEDAGRTWQFRQLLELEDNSVLRIELALAASNPDIMYALRAQQNAAFHSLLRSDDRGLTWTLQSSIQSVGNIFGYFNGTAQFNDLATGQAFYNLALFVDPNDPERVFSGTINIWGSDDGGETFNICSFWQDAFGQSVNNDHHEIVHNPLDGKNYVLHDGGLDVTDALEIGNTNDLIQCLKGTTIPGLFAPNPECYTLPTKWRNLNSGLAISEFYRIMTIPGPGDVVLGGAQDNGSYMHSVEGWQLVFPGDGGDGYIHRENPSTFLVTLQYGNVLRTTDGGNSYRSVNQLWMQDPLQEKPFLTNLYEHPTDPDIVYAPFSDVYRSSDAGNTWSKISDFPSIAGIAPSPGIRAMVVAPSNPDIMYISKRPDPQSGTPASVHRSDDGGFTWNRLNTESLPSFVFYNDLAVDATNPERIWLVSSQLIDGQKVYASEDGGQSWNNISYDLPNVVMNAIEHHSDFGSSGDGITYVGSDFGVFYRTGAMTGWQPLGQGLPQVPVNDLEINDDVGMLYAATYGRGIWKTALLNPTTVAVNKDVAASSQSRLNINPNPARTEISLHTSDIEAGDYTIEVVDAAGRQVLLNTITHAGGQLVWKHPTTNLYSGVYYLRVNGVNTSRATRLQIVP